MTAGWVAPVTRGRAILGRLVGADGARTLAEMSSWDEARAELGRTMYATGLPPDAGRQAAVRSAHASAIWQLRVLAGWMPPEHTVLPRLFAAPFEMRNIEQHLRSLRDHTPTDPLPLGSLAVAWPAVSRTKTVEEARHVLARTVWGDPGSTDPPELALALRVGLARRAVARLPVAKEWACGAVAVLVARERFAFSRPVEDTTAGVVSRLVGRAWGGAVSVTDLADHLPPRAAWPLADVDDPRDLWRAELAVAARVAGDARTLAASNRFDVRTAAAMMALLLVDLWRVQAAIELAGRGPIPTEVFDAVA